MPAAKTSHRSALICGDDEFAVKQRARQLYQQWCDELGGMDHEIIEATVSNSGEALTAMARLREALQTLPFFGTGKVVWLRDCNFLGDERAASAQAVTETLAELAEELKTFSWQGRPAAHQRGQGGQAQNLFQNARQNRLGRNISPAGRRTTGIGRTGRKSRRATAMRARQKEISEEALAELVNRVGPNPRQLDSEVEKLCLFAGDRKQIEAGDVAAVCTRNKTARAFALGDALGDRDLPRLLRRLDEELWEVKFDSRQIGNRPALRPDFQSPRDAVAEGNAARRLDQAGDGLQPVQGATGARAGGQIAGGPAVQSAGA